MADGSDDAEQIDALAKLVERGVVVAAASRYSRGGQQVGAVTPKRMLSKLAGLSLHWFARVGTHDATNSFKAYSRDFIGEVSIQSDAGFEMGIELVAKARRLRRPVAEIPTIWLDRDDGVSNFRMMAWLGRYVRWYLLAFGPKLTLEELDRRTGRRAL
ncbi:MAG: glycosyltransferase family 2 protein, partial [Actinomycetota bacterium]|nr:glycosyltransferase family 2 protein [Actinomycetota bacterium]